MPLEDLLETIETLRERIQDHRPLLSQNEIRTRYALIDPLLRALGWDVSDPAAVVPEQDASGGRADYALLDAEGKPAVMVEAKKLERSLRDGLDQAIAYCVGKGTPYFCVTDGDTWEVYETFRRVPTSEKVITQFKVTRDKPAEVCLKALALWRPSVAEGHVQIAETPLLEARVPSPAPASVPTQQWQCLDCDTKIDESETRLIAGHKAAHTRRRRQTEPRSTTAEAQHTWIPLTELRLEPFAKPSDMLLPSGEQVSMKTWTSLVTKLVQWLVDGGRLSTGGEPLQVGKRYVVAATPTHPDGKPFRQGYQVGALHVETHYSGGDSVRNACRIVEHAGMDPTAFKVRLAD